MNMETTSGVSSTEYRLTGALDSVLEAIKRLFAEYPPQGYGTRVAALQQALEGDAYVARVTRANSCD